MQIAEEKFVPTACWSCAAAQPCAQLICTSCGKVQPVAQADYFEVFSLPRQLNLDLAKMERDFYRLSRKLHPDVYARASAEEQEWSLTNTSLLNDAYRTLKDSVKRTEYLLKLEGVQIAEEDRQREDKGQAKVPAELLEEVFELNMQLEELRMNRKMGEDDPQLRADLERAKKQFEDQLSASDEELRQLWAGWDKAIEQNEVAPRQALKDKMVAVLDRRKYIRNLVRDVNVALEV
jgi:molecular chaperone HscB